MPVPVPPRRAPRRLPTLAAALVALLALPGALAAQDAPACPAYGVPGAPLALALDRPGGGAGLALEAGGGLDLSACGAVPGQGWVKADPDATLVASGAGGADRVVAIAAAAACDAVLLVNGPDGAWSYSDDAEGTDPALRLAAAPGFYDIWVGTYGSDSCPATLSVALEGGAAAPPAALPDPGNLTGFRDRRGEELAFDVTGATDGRIWGDGVYTDDSDLATAAVHAGVLRPGERGVVAVRIEPGRDAYAAASRNGVDSGAYGSWPGAYAFVGAAPPPPAALPDPGSLTGFRGRGGEALTFAVTGSTDGRVWGTDLYTDDSDLSTAAVHAGLLAPGESGTVTVLIEGGQPGYEGSTRNGVASTPYGAWSGSYRFLP